MTLTPKRFLFIWLVLLTAIALIGCSDSSVPPPAPGATPGAGQTPEASTSGSAEVEVTLHAKLSDQQVRELTVAGQELFHQQSCQVCHATDGGKRMGPALNGIYDKQVELADGSTVTQNMDYLYHSITKPSAQVVAGYNPIMTSYDKLSERSRVALVYYIRPLTKAPRAGTEADSKAGSKAKPDTDG